MISEKKKGGAKLRGYKTMTKHIHVNSRDKAFIEADKYIKGDYEYDPVRSGRAGYDIYFSTSDRYEYISDLGDRLEVNMENGDTVNVWIDKVEFEAPETISESELLHLVSEINHTEDHERRKGMLYMLNAICGTKYGLLGGRVVWFEQPDASTCFKYRAAHDLYAELKYRSMFKH